MESSVVLSPSKRFDKLSKDINKLMVFMGLDILSPSLKFNYRTWTLIILCFNFTAFTMFTIFNNGSDWQKNLKTSSMIGGVLHMLGKLLTCFLKQQNMRRLILFTKSIYEEYETRGSSYRIALHTNIDRLLRFIRIIRNGYIVTFFVMISLPMVMLMYDGTRITAMQFEIAGLPLESNFGYTATYVIHFVSLILGGVGFYGGDLFVFLGLTQIITFADLMQLKIDELNETLEHKAKSREALEVSVQIGGEKNRLHLLLEVIKWHQLFTVYCRTVNAIYHELISTQVIAMALSMLLSFCLNLGGFNLSLAVYFVISAYSMSIYCFLGTIIEFGYDQVYESICNVAWFELSVNQRKLFCLMLCESQHPHTIQILGVMSLSMNTALQIAKLIYSVSMMMMNR
ncbi:hypothetical protein KR054_007731 [Drosophila jambulina]|nr:hypothetical protein KR054_007731 [Drosophila jambulina]